MKNIEDINRAYVQKIISKRKIPEFFPGDTLRVGVRIVEGKRERVQNFEGICIAKKNRDINSSFKVRKISFGEGVERTFTLYSPVISSIKVIRSGKVKRAKLYYLRDRKGKSARIAEKMKKNIGIEVEVKSDVETKTNEKLSSDSIKTSTNESKKDIPNQSKKETDKKKNTKPENLKK